MNNNRQTAYYDSTLSVDEQPGRFRFQAATGALCPDGKRRNAHPPQGPHAAVKLSADRRELRYPCFVYVGGTRVRGEVFVDSISLDAHELTVKFIPTGKHAQLVGAA